MDYLWSLKRRREERQRQLDLIKLQHESIERDRQKKQREADRAWEDKIRRREEKKINLSRPLRGKLLRPEYIQRQTRYFRWQKDRGLGDPTTVHPDPSFHTQTTWWRIQHNPWKIKWATAFMGTYRLTFNLRKVPREQRNVRRSKTRGMAYWRFYRGVGRFLKLKKGFINYNTPHKFTNRRVYHKRRRGHMFLNMYNYGHRRRRIRHGGQRLYGYWFPFTTPPQAVQMRRPMRWKAPFRPWLDADVFTSKEDPGFRYAVSQHRYWIESELGDIVKPRMLPDQEQWHYNRYDAMERAHLTELQQLHLDKSSKGSLGLPTNLGYIPNEPKPPTRPEYLSMHGYAPRSYWPPQKKIAIPYQPEDYAFPELVYKDEKQLKEVRKVLYEGLTGGQQQLLQNNNNTFHEKVQQVFQQNIEKKRQRERSLNGLGARRRVTPPTFTIMNAQYDGYNGSGGGGVQSNAKQSSVQEAIQIFNAHANPSTNNPHNMSTGYNHYSHHVPHRPNVNAAALVENVMAKGQALLTTWITKPKLQR